MSSSFQKKIHPNPGNAYFSEGGVFPVPSQDPWAPGAETHAWKTSLEALDRLLRGLLIPEHNTDYCRECKLATLRQQRAEIERTREAAALAGIEIPSFVKNDTWTSAVTLALLRLRREGIACENEPTDVCLMAIESEIMNTQRDIETLGEYDLNMKIFPARYGTSFKMSGTFKDAGYGRGERLRGIRPDVVIIDDVDKDAMDQKKLFESLSRDMMKSTFFGR